MSLPSLPKSSKSELSLFIGSAFKGDSKKIQISSPTNFDHVHHANNSGEAQIILDNLAENEDKFDAPASPILSIAKKSESIMTRLFTKGTRRARQNALTSELNGNGLTDEDKRDVKQEYLLRESISIKKKTEKMSINDFEIIKVLGN